MKRFVEDEDLLPELSRSLGRELPFDPADVNVRSGEEIARSRQSALGPAAASGIDELSDRSVLSFPTFALTYNP